jgi:hypothetical protein
MKTIQKNARSIFRKTLFAALAVTTLVITSCRKDDDAPAPPQVQQTVDFLPGFLSTSGLDKNEKFANIYDPKYEYGVIFSAQADGKMLNVKVNVPLAESVRVTLWDYTTQTILYSTTLTSIADQWVTKDFGNYAIEKNKKYLLSINNRSYNWRTKIVGGTVSYPIVYDKFVVYGYRSAATSQQIFPTNPQQSAYGGDVTFDFQTN